MKYTLVVPKYSGFRSEREFLKELKSKVQHGVGSKYVKLCGVSNVDADHFGLLYEETDERAGVYKFLKKRIEDGPDRLVDGWIGEQIF